jgi:transposase
VPGTAADRFAGKKKSLHADERDTPRVKRARSSYRRRIFEWVMERLLFIDEIGVNISLTRLYGRAAPGVRVHEGVPQNYGENISMLGALGTRGLCAPMTVNGAVDGEVFRAYVRELLSPVLRKGDVVLMDNLQAHKVSGIEEMIRERGARLEYLPPYSPDLNPIEQCWSKIKAFLRKKKARTRRALETAIKQALSTITEADARAWFDHCGYALH